MKDREFLEWLRQRLINMYDVDQDIDYMLKLEGIIKDCPDDKNSPLALRLPYDTSD